MLIPIQVKQGGTCEPLGLYGRVRREDKGRLANHIRPNIEAKNGFSRTRWSYDVELICTVLKLGLDNGFGSFL